MFIYVCCLIWCSVCVFVFFFLYFFIFFLFFFFFFFSSRRRHTRCGRDWGSDVCSSDLLYNGAAPAKILDFLTTFHEYDYSKMDIAKNSGVSFRHTLLEIKKLADLELIKQTRTVGHARSEERRVGKECR